MTSLLSQLPVNSDALLIMLAAGELPREDEQAVQAMLAEDGELRTRFATTCDHLDAMDQQFFVLDAWDGIRPDFAMRQAVEAIRNWQLGRSSAVTQVTPPLNEPVRRWGVPSAAAALIALGLGVTAVVTYLGGDRAKPTAWMEEPEMTTGDIGDNPLALHAAASLAVGPEVDEDTPPASPMPPTADEPLANWDEPFFDIPVIANADSAP